MSLSEKTPVLDHGYVRLIESWGSDERIIEAARMSTDKGFQGWGPSTVMECVNPLCPGYSWQRGLGTEDAIASRAVDGMGMYCPNCSSPLVVQKEKGRAGDEKLLRYLYEHKHVTPFEMAGMTLEIQAPIFVFREWHRHRTQSYNEMSARYTPLPDLNYIPTVERLMLNSKTNRQAGTVKGAEELTEPIAYDYQTLLDTMYEEQEGLYQHALRSGIPKELARIHLPVGRYSRMRASANLRNWLGFLTLRLDPAAQWEIREFAQVVGRNVAVLFPRTWELFIEGAHNVR